MTNSLVFAKKPEPSVERPQGSRLYHYAGGLISTSWALKALHPVENIIADERTITTVFLPSPPSDSSVTIWLHHWPPDRDWLPERGEMSLALLDEKNRLLLRFHDLADFEISADGRQIGVWAAPSSSEETLEHLLLDQVLPRIMAQHGQLVLHAGAVQVGRQSIAFVGDSGTGKSTLTASFQVAGHSLLCDDGLALMPGENKTMASPTYASLRLWPDSIDNLYVKAPSVAPMAHYTSKQRIVSKHIETGTNDRCSLASLFVLNSEVSTDDGEISIERLSAREACIAIVRNSFQLDPTDSRHVANVFASASRIADHLPVWSLSYPRDFARLLDVHDVILKA